MAIREYDTFMLSDPVAMPEDQQLELIVRDLTPADRRYKYRSFFAQARISKSKTRYADRLWIRLGRGQLLEDPWSIEILEEIDKFTER